MTSTVALYLCTAGLLFPVMFVNTLTVERVISLTSERHVCHASIGHGIQCSGPAASGSHSAQESRT